MSENGSCRPGNLGDGAKWVGEMKVIGRFCFAKEARGSVKNLSGNEHYSLSRKECELVLKLAMVVH